MCWTDLEREKRKHIEAGGAASLMATVFSTRPCVSTEKRSEQDAMQIHTARLTSTS